MNLEKLVEIMKLVKDENTTDSTFLEVGKSYGIRTVTMIYTGKIKKMTGQEIVLEKAAWIAETERWYEFTKDLSARE